MAEEAPSCYGSIRVRASRERLIEIQAEARKIGLSFESRDLYDRWSRDRIWSFDFHNKESFFMFHMIWEDHMISYKVY